MKIELAYRASSFFFVLRFENMIGKYHGYDITEIELLSPKPRIITMSEDHVALLSSSISLAKLLKEICVRA